MIYSRRRVLFGSSFTGDRHAHFSIVLHPEESTRSLTTGFAEAAIESVPVTLPEDIARLEEYLCIV